MIPESWNKYDTELYDVDVSKEDLATKTQNHKLAQKINLVSFSTFEFSWQFLILFSILIPIIIGTNI